MEQDIEKTPERKQNSIQIESSKLLGYQRSGAAAAEAQPAPQTAGIADLPGEFEEFLRSPGAYGPEDRESLEEAVAKWRREGRFVLEWSGNYWMSADGEVIGRSG